MDGDAKLLLVAVMEEGSCRGRDKGGRESRGEKEKARRGWKTTLPGGCYETWMRCAKREVNCAESKEMRLK